MGVRHRGSRRHLRATLRGVGGILQVAAGVMVASALTGLVYREWWAALWLLVAAVTVVGLGLLARHFAHDPASFDLQDAMTTAGVGWATVALVGALPFVLAAYLTPDATLASYVPAAADYAASSLLHFRNPLHAIFESMSGWTTTGLTMAVHEPSMPNAFLMYRSLMQWAGGAGIIVLALTVFQQHGGVQGMFLYEAEGRRQRLRPSIIETARRVWRIYVVVTAALAAYLFIATLVALPGYPITRAAFDAINHAMTGQSTGGFSTLDDSIAGYGSYAMDLIHLVPMISGAIALPVHYLALQQRKPGAYLHDVQNKVMFALFAVGGVGLSGLLIGAGAISDPTREGVFQWISALSTTGWQTSDIANWPAAAAIVIVAAMVIGGTAGATVGGIKVLRLIYLAKGAWWQVREVFQPSQAVNIFKIGEERLNRSEFERESGRAAGFLFLWIVGLAVSVLIMATTLDGDFTLADMIFESATAQGTVGLSAGITGPDMPVTVETTFIIQMWLGRLEIIPVLVALRAIFVRFGSRAAPIERGT